MLTDLPTDGFKSCVFLKNDSQIVFFRTYNIQVGLMSHWLTDMLFRWFKFALKPPYRITHSKLRLAIWDTSFWTFWLKFGHKGP